MINENNMPIVEATVRPRFNPYTSSLEEHLKKHVLNRDERWFSLKNFDPEIIAAAQNGEKKAIELLKNSYETVLGRVALECCRDKKNHIHLLAALPQLPERLAKDKTWDRKPELLIKCLGVKENLFVLIAAPVRNGKIEPYYIKTGFRTFPKLSQNSWIKNELKRERDDSDIYQGKKQTLIADHI